ncbi:MAG: ParA family protein [Anaerolineales bacterium]|jgi:chromosome partitioning protein
MTTIVAIANEKGGVAKTTSALSIGAALVERGHEILLVDLDPQANLTLAMGIQPDQARHSVADLLLGNTSPMGVSRETNVPGLDLIPASGEMLLVERFLYVRQKYEHLLRKALAKANMYDMVLLDCPPSLGALTINALTAAQLLVIPTQCEYFSAHALREMLDLIRNIRQRSNPSLRYRVLITMLGRTRVHKTLQEQIRSAFGNAVFATAVENDTKLRECPVVGIPITQYAPESRAAVQYRALAQELEEYVHQAIAQPA